jgi:transcriptional regulator with XRE-family HTH domain
VELSEKQKAALAALRERICDELAAMKQQRFGDISERDFEIESRVSRGSIVGVERETEKSLPNLETIYLWVTACGSSLAQLFQSPPVEYEDKLWRLHQHLDYVLKMQKPPWIETAIESEYSRLKPKPRQVKTKRSEGRAIGQEKQERPPPGKQRNASSR